MKSILKCSSLKLASKRGNCIYQNYLFTRIEKMGVDDLKYFQKRSGPVLCKVLLLIAKQKFKTL